MKFYEYQQLELALARRKHNPMCSLHEAHSLILEELEEAWAEIKKKNPDKVLVLQELIQVAAMCQRCAEDVLPGVVPAVYSGKEPEPESTLPVTQLHGTIHHRLTEDQAEEDALILSRKWNKPFWIYFDELQSTWNYSTEFPLDRRHCFYARRIDYRTHKKEKGEDEQGTERKMEEPDRKPGEQPAAGQRNSSDQP